MTREQIGQATDCRLPMLRRRVLDYVEYSRTHKGLTHWQGPLSNGIDSETRFHEEGRNDGSIPNPARAFQELVRDWMSMNIIFRARFGFNSLAYLNPGIR